MQSKKAQLSIETMIIYGLIILVTLSVIGGLLYFNILDLSAYLPDKCDIGGTGDLKCEEMKVSGNSIQVGVRNVGQKPINNLAVTLDDRQDTVFTGELAGVVSASTLAPGEITTVTFTLSSAAPSGRVLRASMKTDYRYAEGAILNEARGDFRVKSQ